jgi:NADPH:quinone reductase-like Zn-dependent oxidoreductase
MSTACVRLKAARLSGLGTGSSGPFSGEDALLYSPAVTARAFWITGPGRGEIRAEPLGRCGAGEAQVRTIYSAVSRGTEALVFGGHVPASEYERMRCPHQAGAFPGPVKYGYSNVGRVVDGPEPLKGRVVFCLYPHQTAFVVPDAEAVCVPDQVPPARAVLAANMETALNALWDATPLAGDRISIVGAGVIGCLCAHLARQIPAAEVELVDVRSERAEVAKALGAAFADPAHASRERDIVMHASATEAGLRTALSLAAADATILELSWFGDAPVSLHLGEAFHARRLALRSSQVGTVSPTARRRWTRPGRLELALRLCADPVLDALVSEECEFEDLPETMARIARPAAATLCLRVRYAPEE